MTMAAVSSLLILAISLCEGGLWQVMARIATLRQSKYQAAAWSLSRAEFVMDGIPRGQT